MTPEEIEAAARQLDTRSLGLLTRSLSDEYERRLRFMPEPTDTERELHAAGRLIDVVKEVRNRTGLGLVDAKKLVDTWKRNGIL